MTKKLDNSQKQAQKLLSDATTLLKEAGKLAEDGKFTLRFMGHDYYPKSVYGKDYDSWDSMSIEQKAARLGIIDKESDYDAKTDDEKSSIESEVEYATPGKFWQASTC